MAALEHAPNESTFATVQLQEFCAVFVVSAIRFDNSGLCFGPYLDLTDAERAFQVVVDVSRDSENTQ